MTIYEIIKSLCDKNDIPVTKLEMELGFGRGSIGKLKKGGSPSYERLEKIANYFNVPVDYFRFESDEVSIRLDDKSVISDTKAFIAYVDRLGWSIKEVSDDKGGKHYILSDGQLSITVPEDEFVAMENKVRNICENEILGLVAKSINDRYKLAGKPDNAVDYEQITPKLG